MSRILLISNHGGGFYNFKKELVEELVSLEYEVHFAVPFDEKVSELINLGAKYHKIIIDRRGVNPIKDLGLIGQFRRIIKNVKPHIMVLHTIKPNIYGSALAKFYKISYINNITGLGSALQQNNAMAKILRFLYRTSLSKSSGVFFENTGNEQYFKKYELGDPSVYHIVPGAGVNLIHFKKNQYKKNMDTNTNTICFQYIGRIMRDKGVNELFFAIKYLKNKYSNVNFQIVGFYDEPEYEMQIKELVAEGAIEFLGQSEDTRLEMSQADCIVLPSYHEGMSNVLLEGAAAGLPLITTDIPGCREAVEHKKNGFLCKVKDSESLTDAMEKFLALSKEERAEMGNYGRLKMEREFDREIVVDRYIQCIQSAIKEQ